MSAKKLCITWAIVFLLMLASFVRRKKIRIVPSVLLTACVTFFTLLSPLGKTLTIIRSFRITQDALFIGLQKSAVLVGMVFFSQTIVSYNITLPGKAGRLIADVLFWFNQLTVQRISFKKGHIIAQIDEILCNLWKQTA